MCELVINDLVEELYEENQRLTEELNELKRQLRDNARLGSVDSKSQTHHVIHRPSGRPSMVSTVGTQTSDAFEDIKDVKDIKDIKKIKIEVKPIVAISGDNDSAVVSHSYRWDPLDVMSGETDTKPVIADHSVSAMDGNQSDTSDQLLDTSDGLNESMTTHVTSDSVGTSMAANKQMLRFKCLVEDCDREYFSKTSLIGHIISGHRIEDIYECEECDDLFLSIESLIGHKHRAHTSAAVVSTRETSDGLAAEFALKRHIHETNALNDNQMFEIENNASEQVSESNGSTDSSYRVSEFNESTDSSYEVSEYNGSTSSSYQVSESNGSTDSSYKEIIDSDNTDDNDSDSDCMDAFDGQSGGFRCDYKDCHKVFTESKAYGRHRLTHLADKRLKCPLNDCDYRCDRRFQLREHMSDTAVDHMSGHK